MRVTDAQLHYTGAWLLLAFGISFSTAAYAGMGVWTSGGPYSYRGQVNALAISPVAPATLYAGTSGTGVFKSTDSGGTWTAINTGLTTLNVGSLVINPSTPATLYAGTDVGIFKSTDSGGTWAVVSAGLTNPWVISLAINPANPATLYAGGVGGVFKSTDSGGTWAAVNTGLPNLSVYSLAINPSTPSTLYAGIGGNGKGTGAGVFKSTDSGGTWVAANIGLTNLDVDSLAINPATPATLYAGTNGGGVYKSTDSGDTWAAANTGLKDLTVLALAINPATPTTLYAGMDADGHPSIFKSTDSGDTWVAVNTLLWFVNALAINPATPTTLYAGSSYGGVFKSTDSGDTWAIADTGLGPGALGVLALAIDPTTLATLYAGTDAGFSHLYKSTDSGGTWAAAKTEPTNQRVNSLAIDPLTPSTLYAGTGGDLIVGGFGGGAGVFKSTDSGSTWAAANMGLTDLNLEALAINPATPSTLYAATHGGGVFKSTDSGGSWAASNTGLTNLGVFALSINPATPATLYAGTIGGGVFKSTDSGGTWAAVNGGLTNLNVDALAVNPATPSTLYAGTYGGGVFKSTDSGGTWAAASRGLSEPTVLALVINPATPTTLYAGTFYGGVFKSTDSGGSWAAINVGLPSFPVGALALDSRAATTLYAGLGGGSVWQSTPPGGPPSALLPASAHSTGLGGAFYTTDVSVSNVGSSNASFTLKFLGNNQDGSSGPEKDFSLDPGKSTTFLDVLGSVFNQTTNFGAIRITSNTSTLDVVSVTSTPGFGGTFGQTLPAVSSSDLIPAGSSRSILYIREGDGFRSNLILASSASVSTNIDVALVSPAGSTLATKTYSVPPNGMTQINKVVRDMGVSGAVTGARLVVSSSNPRSAFAAAASVIDETTNDPAAVIAQPASVSGSAPYIWLLPSSAHSSGLSGSFYTTNLAVANVGAAPASFTMKFLGNNHDGSGGPEQTFDLESGKSVVYFDVLGSVFNQTSNFGAIRVTSTSSSLNIVSVTSTPGFGGTFGLTIPAVFSGDLIPAGSPRSVLDIREADGFRSNLILASNVNVSTTVDVALVSPAGTALAAKSYSVPPNGMTQVNRVVRDMGVSGAITGARLVLSSSTPNAAFTGLASVIDETTNDPTAVEAQ